MNSIDLKLLAQIITENIHVDHFSLLSKRTKEKFDAIGWHDRLLQYRWGSKIDPFADSESRLGIFEQWV
jgi:hypothetical protein